ncbi:MAG: HAMP domain-containing histidine kinase [Ruminococcus sp.]|nr:HAMP domain-containing histidine kinase [Ruminococcus sp.]
MKSYNRLIAAAAVLFAALFIVINLLIPYEGGPEDRTYIVEAERLAKAIDAGQQPDISETEYITSLTLDDGSERFYSEKGNFIYRRTSKGVCRFGIRKSSGGSTRLILNLTAGAAALITFGVLIYLKRRLVKPFNELSELPYELAKGNLTVPLKEDSGRYFGRFIWGTDMLRESLEQQKERELSLHRDRQTLLLSISHDIKSPLSAIKLSVRALQKGIYEDEARQREVIDGIGDRADEIESYVSSLISSVNDDFLTFTVREGEEYLSELAGRIERYYSDKLAMTHTAFVIGEYSDCLIKCDPDRAEEVLQNLMENAIKYGDGREIALSFSEEEDCRLITVSNTGCTLPREELIHIFDSFRRGTNSDGKPGSGLGLYICRRLMTMMGGDIFARIEDGRMNVTAVFRKA